MSQWILITPDEDGDPVRYLDRHALEELMSEPASWGVREFLAAVPEETDTNYWPAGAVLLMRAEVVVPRPVTTAWEIP